MIVRLCNRDDGESYFEDVELEFGPHLPLSEQTATLPTETIHFARHLPGYFMDWHSAPRRQYIAFLAGQTEIEVAGEKRILVAGDVLFAEDTKGRHTVRVISEEPRLSLTVPLRE